ncbi:MAG: hypothetical protein EOO43_00845 [Flavobacterium sp.]|nr:MAG: hypothetical protein EOO43_00845 [Flavobacterium sp.]
MEIIGELPATIDTLVSKILFYALILASVSTITMTFLELIKVLISWRLKYHKRRVEIWLANNDCLEELLILTVAEVESADALFDQPTDKMMGQIQAATNVAIDFPKVYPNLYYFLTKPPKSKAAAVETGGTGMSPVVNEPTDAEIWKDFISREPYFEGDKLTELDRQRATSDLQSATKARARIDHFVARKLDAFQTQAEYEWARKNQYWSVGAAAALIFVLLLNLKFPVLPAVVLAFFGGMMAPLAKDVVAALSGLRGKS